MERWERMSLIKAAARGDGHAIQHWASEFSRLVRFQCAKSKVPYSDEVESMVRLAVWKCAQRYEFTERTGYGNTWVSYLKRALTNLITDAAVQIGRRKESPSDILPEQTAPEERRESPGFVLILQWQDYCAFELSDLECDTYADIRRREDRTQLFEAYDDQYSCPQSFLANDGILLIRFFEDDPAPSWPRFAKAHRLSRAGIIMLQGHLARALDTVPFDVP
jgi:hypothetical protein